MVSALRELTVYLSCSIGINRFRLVGLVWFFCVLLGKKRFGLVYQLFQSASNQVEMVATVSTENGWKSVLLGNLNRFNLNQLWLKRLIPIEHDLIFNGENLN